VSRIAVWRTGDDDPPPTTWGILRFIATRLIGDVRRFVSKEHSETDSIEVRLRILAQDGKIASHDLGLLIVVDGWLLFEGAHTAFALNRNVAVPSNYVSMGDLQLRDGRTVALIPVDRKQRPTALERSIAEWVRAPIAHGVPILPPHGADPLRWVRTSALCVLASVLYLVLVLSGFWVGAVLGVPAFVWLVGAIVHAARRYRRERPKSALPTDPLWREDSTSPQSLR
jgi:hypothetical protein